MADKQVTDKQVLAAREKVEKKRETLADLQTQLAASEAARNNAVRLDQLQRQDDELASQIAQTREALKRSRADVNLTAPEEPPPPDEIPPDGKPTPDIVEAEKNKEV